jgi:predicted ATPase
VRLKSRELIPLDDAQQIVEGLRTERPNLKKINDVKRRLAALATERKVTLVPNDSDIELTLYDVGVGLSQLIPVVVTALDSEGRLAGIEAPEYHLHPRLQAELGDLFIESAVGKKATLLVETHSEHLVLRIQRRIRETSRGKASAERAVTTDDVAVHHLRQKKGQTLVRKIDIDKHGEFVQPWPDDFFELDFYERFH